jgi:hypothetical protein
MVGLRRDAAGVRGQYGAGAAARFGRPVCNILHDGGLDWLAPAPGQRDYLGRLEARLPIRKLLAELK